MLLMKTLRSRLKSLITYGRNPLLPIALCCGFAVLGTSCEEEGACEVKIPLSNYSLYSCREGVIDEHCKSSSSADRVFHEGKSCASLGYIYADNKGGHTADADNLRTPGKNGAFQNDLSSGGIGGCNGGYNGPTFDIQIDSQCQTAYAYTCAGSTEGVKAACAIYKGYQQSNPSIPNCPYCN